MLYIVATPIGNLADMTFRAVECLKESSIILCEDTRHSKTLLDKFDIKSKLVSYHKFNEASRLDYIVSCLKEGETISLITDAGTPIISDPGYLLIKRIREEGLEYTSIPGACAMVNGLVLSGLDSSAFSFLGFIPKNKKRKSFLENAEKINHTLMFYLSPHSYKEDIKDLYKVLGDRSGVLVREMTKKFEQVIDITLSPDPQLDIKGEMVLVLDGKTQSEQDITNLSPMEHLLGYINSGMDKNTAIKRVAKERQVPKNEIYQLLNNKP